MTLVCPTQMTLPRRCTRFNPSPASRVLRRARSSAARLGAGGVLCELQQLWVEPTHRRRGLGTQLVQSFETHARKRRCTSFYLETFNFQAPELYQALGYAVAFEDCVYPHGVIKYVMVKHVGSGDARPNRRFEPTAASVALAVLSSLLVGRGSSATLKSLERVLYTGGLMLTDVGSYWPLQYAPVSRPQRWRLSVSMTARGAYRRRVVSESWTGRCPGAVRGAPAVRDGAQRLPVGRESGPLDDQEPSKGRGAGKRRR